MRKEVVVFVFLLSIIFFLQAVSASELTQVEKAYTCLENKVNLTKCSSLTFEERVFSLLATGLCQKEVSSDNLSNQCWPKSECKIKSTAQAVLALNKKTNTTKAETWLLSQTSVPTELDWFLEIESLSATSCTITYSDSSYYLTIGENKKISSSNLGTCLSLAQDNYWLRIAPSCYNREIYISCNNPDKNGFITTLLFKRKDSSTVHVSEKVHSAPAGGRTMEKVDALCFSQEGVCDYEGSLWATIVLYSLNYDVSRFMPYLITMMDTNSKYLPESFLYFLTGKFESELLLKQNGFYWDVSGDRYYDTALALWPFYYSNPYEKESSKEWLLRVQESTGCWNGGNIRNTAFILYSVWPKAAVPPGPGPECLTASDCLSINCQISSCVQGVCFYDYVSCKNNDGCCPPGCTYSNDNDCVPGQGQCSSDIDCEVFNSVSSNYCDGNSVYKDIFNYNCQSQICVLNKISQLVETCGSDEQCSSGYCVPAGNGGGGGEEPERECWFGWDCPDVLCKDAYCSGGVCLYEYFGCINNDGCCNPGCSYLNDNDCGDPPQCIIDDDCSYLNYESSDYCSENKTEIYMDVFTYYCEDEICVENKASTLIDTCNTDEECSYGVCSVKGIILGECDYWWDCLDGEDCINGECVPTGSADCIESGYFCMSAVECGEGNLLGSSYACTGIYDCCDTEKNLGVCSDYGGIICESWEGCIGGTSKDTYDITAYQICCVGGTCGTFSSECTTDSECPGGKCIGGICSYDSSENSCSYNGGVCKTSCGKKEQEIFYTCEGNTICCKEVKKSSGWVWIIILLLLIMISAAGIIFRDKLRTEWVKLKSKFGKKKDKGRIGMPIVSPGTPQHRILPRRIYPPSAGHPTGSRQMPMRRPVPGKIPEGKAPPKKPEEKSKGELDDVLKKLRDMGK